MLPESSSAVSSSRETPAPQYSLEDIAFSENPEIPGSLEISYPSGMLSGQPLWIDATHIYLQPKKKAVKFGVIADLENRTFTQTPEQYFLWTNIGYQNDNIYLVEGGSYVEKRDKNLNLLSSVSYESEANDYIYALHPVSETLYYIQQDDPEKPLLCRKKGGESEVMAELPPLGEKEYYHIPSISPSGDKLLFGRIYYEGLVKIMYFYDIPSDTLSESVCESENDQLGFWMPSTIWIGEQPAFLLYHEDEKNSNEILFGFPPKSKVQSFYPRNEFTGSIYYDNMSPWSCISYTLDAFNKKPQKKLFYFRDNGTYLSYMPKNQEGFSVFYPQLSPDYGYLSFVTSSDNPDVQEKLCMIPSEPLWKPLDWSQVQAEMDALLSDISAQQNEN